MKNKRFLLSIREKYLLIAPATAILFFSFVISGNVFNVNGDYKTEVLLWWYPRMFSILFTVILGFRNVIKGIRKNKSHYLKFGTFAVFTYVLTFSSTFFIPFLMSVEKETFVTTFKVMTVFLLVLGNIIFLINLRRR